MPPTLSPSRKNGNRQLAPLLVFFSYAMLVVAWIFGNPPPAAPDELWHYMRAVSSGHGQLVGQPGGREGAKAMVGERPATQSEQSYEEMLAFIAQTNRWVQIPPGFSLGWFRCPVVDPNESARCLNVSRPLTEARDWFISAGTYQPLPYLVPAAISRSRVHPDHLDLLRRAGRRQHWDRFAGGHIYLLLVDTDEADAGAIWRPVEVRARPKAALRCCLSFLRPEPSGWMSQTCRTNGSPCPA